MNILLVPSYKLCEILSQVANSVQLWLSAHMSNRTLEQVKQNIRTDLTDLLVLQSTIITMYNVAISLSFL